MTPQLAAYIYALALMAPRTLQIALVFGAPWGFLTMGGMYPARLPARGRVLACVQIAIQLLMLWVVLGHAGLLEGRPPSWAIWCVLAVTLLSAVANWATPSPWERRLWGPITVVLLASVLGVMFL